MADQKDNNPKCDYCNEEMMLLRFKKIWHCKKCCIDLTEDGEVEY